MAKTIKITTDNILSIIDINWDIESYANVLDCSYTETVKTEYMYALFDDTVVMIVDSDGDFNNKPINILGSVLYGTPVHHKPILGDIIFGLQRGPQILPPENIEQLQKILLNKFDFLKETEIF